MSGTGGGSTSAPSKAKPTRSSSLICASIQRRGAAALEALQGSLLCQSHLDCRCRPTTCAGCCGGWSRNIRGRACSQPSSARAGAAAQTSSTAQHQRVPAAARVGRPRRRAAPAVRREAARRPRAVRAARHRPRPHVLVLLRRLRPERRARLHRRDDHLIKAWDAESCLLLHTLRGHKGEVGELDVHAAGGLLASASNDGTSRVWAIGGASTPPCVAAFACRVEGDTDPEAQVTAATWRPAAGAQAPPQLLSVSNTGHVFLHTAPPAADDAASAAAAPAVAPPPADQAAGWELAERSGAGAGRARARRHRQVRHVLHEVERGRRPLRHRHLRLQRSRLPPPRRRRRGAGVVATLRGHRHDVTSLSWAAAGDRILSGSVDGTARLWSLKGEMVGRALASSSDGPRRRSVGRPRSSGGHRRRA